MWLLDIVMVMENLYCQNLTCVTWGWMAAESEKHNCKQSLFALLMLKFTTRWISTGTICSSRPQRSMMLRYLQLCFNSYFIFALLFLFCSIVSWQMKVNKTWNKLGHYAVCEVTILMFKQFLKTFSIDDWSHVKYIKTFIS